MIKRRGAREKRDEGESIKRRGTFRKNSMPGDLPGLRDQI